MARKREIKYTNQKMDVEKGKPTKGSKSFSNVSLSPDVMRKEQLAQRKQQSQKKTSGNVWDDLGNTFLKNPLGTLKAAAEVGKEALNKKKESVKAPAKNAVASDLKGNNGGSVKSSAKDTAYRNMANRKAQATKQNTTQAQPKKTFNANEAMAQRRAAAQAQGKGSWNANEEMARRRAEAQKKKAYQNAFGGKGK